MYHFSPGVWGVGSSGSLRSGLRSQIPNGYRWATEASEIGSNLKVRQNLKV